ncbi:MAG: hypothetical protein ACLR4X_00125 [Clostridia bacterium]
MAKYNITQIQKMVDRLAKIGINTEKAILNMEFEDLEKMPSYTKTDIKTLITLRKAIRKNKKALVLFLGEETK